jgi:large subunit ribosomal protein L21
MITKSNSFAVLKIQGKQYLVFEGKEFEVDKLDGKDLSFEVLLTCVDNKISIGKPYLKTHQVKLKQIGQEKGEKVDVLKYKAKSRYRRHYGFRPVFTRLQIVKI